MYLNVLLCVISSTDLPGRQKLKETSTRTFFLLTPPPFSLFVGPLSATTSTKLDPCLNHKRAFSASRLDHAPGLEKSDFKVF